MDLRKTLLLVRQLFSNSQIEHALIGGLAMACHGSTRATVDVDFLIHEEDKDVAKKLLMDGGFILDFESQEVLQFSGIGFLDILLARRPISKEMLLNAEDGGPHGIKFLRAEDIIGLKIQAYKNDPRRAHQDKSDIQYLIGNAKDLNWEKIKSYADLFNEWEAILEIKNKN